MIYNQNEKANPAAEYLFELQMIVNNTTFKNKDEANKYETTEYKLAGMEYINAKNKTDTFEAHQYSSKQLYNIMSQFGYPEDQIFFYIKNPSAIPFDIKRIMLQDRRDYITSTYVEKNKYYSTLAGIPFAGTDEIPADEIVTIPDGFYYMYSGDSNIMRGQPIHTMTPKYIELFMNSDFYPQILAEHPNAEYLKYIGSRSIPIEVSRPAKDGDILKINIDKLTQYHEVYGTVTVSPGIIHQFINSYKETRDYIYNTLRGDFEVIYANYNSFIRFLTIYMTIGNALNELIRQSTYMINMSDTTANNYFMLYGLPSVIMEGTSMISFLKQFRMILMDKGTNIVYRVKDLVGYEYTDIFTLVMVKQQVFENGTPIYYTDEDKKLVPKQNIIFRRLGTTDENTSYFKFRDSNKTYTWQEIASGDPRWWNTPEVERLLYDMNYTLSNSKYIQLSTHMSMDDIYWQCVILLRGLLDNRYITSNMKFSINYDLNGSSELSVFDAVLILVIIMNWNNVTVKGPFDGQLYQYNGTYNGQAACLDQLFNGLQEDGTPNELKLGMPFKLSSFNFELSTTEFDWFNYVLPTYTYLEPNTLIPLLESIYTHKNNNIGETLMTDVRKVYDFLNDKLQATTTIEEFRQVTEAFNKFFLVDPIRDWFDTSNQDTDAVLMDMYGLSIQDLNSLKAYYYHNDKIVSINFRETTYDVSLSAVMNQNVNDIIIDEVYIFRNNEFVDAFNNYILTSFTDEALEQSNLSTPIKSQYKSIIETKVILDTGISESGPTSFESMLFRQNTSLYHTLIALKSNPESLILLMRAIIKGLESYTNSNLNGLEYTAIGEKEYYRILKEIITYFKSYMVEFTKEEFVFLFNGLFDNGGNSNMLKLFDEIHSSDAKMIPYDSLTLYDVTNSSIQQQLHDDNVGLIHDEAIISMKTTYNTLTSLGYEVWFDDGDDITMDPPPGITGDTEVFATIFNSDDGEMVIIDSKKL
jgi:hypothetical protein